MVGLGTLVNGIGIVAGGLAGCLFGRLLKEKQQDALIKACGLCVLFLAVAGAMEEMLTVEGTGLVSGKSMLVALSIAIGTLLGEIIDIESKIEKFGSWIKKITGNGKDDRFVDAFVTASLTVCIGAMAIVGAIQDGLSGDPSLLFVKTLLDFVIIIVMTASLGKGCIFSAIPVLILEGAVTLFASLLSPVLTEAMIGAVSLVGSLLIFGVGVNLIWEKKFRVANMLPSVIVAALLVPLLP